jgi:hypothetical protein
MRLPLSSCKSAAGTRRSKLIYVSCRTITLLNNNPSSNLPQHSNLLEESISIADNIPEAKGSEARAQHKLSQLYDTLGNAEKSQECKDMAKKAAAEVLGATPNAAFSENDYDNMVLWMLW